MIDVYGVIAYIHFGMPSLQDYLDSTSRRDRLVHLAMVANGTIPRLL